MNILVTIVIFFVVLLVYTHILDEFKRGEDLEIYETDFVDNEQLNEICKLKQPILFGFKSTAPRVFDKLASKADVSRESNDMVQVFETTDFYSSSSSSPASADSPLPAFPLPFDSAVYLMETDQNRRYVTERNEVFMKESGLWRFLSRELNSLLRPAFGTIFSSHDLLFGSEHASTPCRYHVSSRYFLGVTSGKVVVRMSPWKSAKYLDPQTDYATFDFRTTAPLTTHDGGMSHGSNALKYMEFVVKPGSILSIPPFWFYSIEFCSQDSLCFSSRYVTIANGFAHVDRLAQYLWEQRVVSSKAVTTTTTTTRTQTPLAGQQLRDGNDEKERRHVKKEMVAASMTSVNDTIRSVDVIREEIASGGGGGRGGGGAEKEEEEEGVLTAAAPTQAGGGHDEDKDLEIQEKKKGTMMMTTPHSTDI